MLRFVSAQTQDKGVYESLDRTTNSATWEPEQAYYTYINPQAFHRNHYCPQAGTRDTNPPGVDNFLDNFGLINQPLLIHLR